MGARSGLGARRAGAAHAVKDPHRVGADAKLDVALAALPALWVGISNGEVFAPYDGDVDCILASSARRDSLKARHADWLSERADGL